MAQITFGSTLGTHAALFLKRKITMDMQIVLWMNSLSDMEPLQGSYLTETFVSL